MNLLKGRVNRKQYLIGQLIFIPYALIVSILGAILLSIINTLNVEQDLETRLLIFLVIQFFLNISLLYYQYNLQFKRLRDINWSIWPIVILSTLQIIIIFFKVNKLIEIDDSITQYLEPDRFGDSRITLILILYSIVLFFVKGNEGENKYGSDPRDKTALEAIFGIKKKEKINKEFKKIENVKDPKSKYLVIATIFISLIISSLIYYFIYLPTSTKNERISCLDNANKIPNTIRREREIEICVLKYK